MRRVRNTIRYASQGVRLFISCEGGLSVIIVSKIQENVNILMPLNSDSAPFLCFGQRRSAVNDHDHLDLSAVLLSTIHK